MQFIILLLLIALAALLGLRRRQAAPKPAALEYWVYLPTDTAPTQDAILSKLFEIGAIGPQEGLVFSDIRLHMALIRREKNAHLFLLDLLQEAVPLDEAHLTELANAASIFKIRYVCEPPPKDDRHLRTLPQIARVAAALGGSNMIYDLYQRRVMTIKNMNELVSPKGPGAASSETHVQVLWIPGMEPRAETRGLRKKQMPELVTDAMESDEENLVTYVITEAVRFFWSEASLAQRAEVEYFGSQFLVEALPYPANALQAKVRILRKETP